MAAKAGIGVLAVTDHDTVSGLEACEAAAKELGDIVLLDIPDRVGVAQGKALDLAQCGPIERFDAQIVGTSDYKDTANSDVVVITAGMPRKPGMSRDDLIGVNVKIVKDVTEQVAKHSPNAVLIIVSNPLDAMVYTAWKVSGFPTNRILGQAGALDVARFRTFLAMKLGCSIEDITSLLLGGHGDDMVPLPRFTSVAGIPIDQLLPASEIQECVERAKVGGGEIVKLMGTSAWYAPSAGTVEMVESIVRDKKRVIASAAYCEDEYGVAPGQKGKGLFVGVPCVVGSRGVEKIISFKLDETERKFMDESISHVRDLIGVVKRMFPEMA